MSASSVGGLALKSISQGSPEPKVLTILKSRKFRYLSKFFPGCAYEDRANHKNPILRKPSNALIVSLVLFYVLIDWTFYSLKKLISRSIHSSSISFRSELEKFDVGEIEFVISDGEFLEMDETSSNKIRIDLNFMNVKGFGFFDFTQSLSELSSSFIVQAHYQMGKVRFSREYKFNKFSSCFMSRDFLIFNLQSLVIDDLYILQQNINGQVTPTTFPVSPNVAETSRLGEPQLFLKQALMQFYLPKLLPKMHERQNESDWMVLLSDQDGRWQLVPNTEGSWFADPHLFRIGKKTIMLVEDFDLLRHKGRISQSILGEGQLQPPRVVIDRLEHVSFPQTFFYCGEIWLSLECHESGGVPLYKFNDSKENWEYFSTALPERRLVDPLIFQQDEGWYLMATEKAGYGEDYYSKLLLFYAKDPISNTWESFRMNPVMFNNMAGRNGGLFRDSDSWIRVAQETARGVYGNAISFRRIEKISTDEFTEIPIDFPLPALPNNVSRVHSFTKLGSLIAIDAKFRKS